MSSASPATGWTGAGNAFSKTPLGIVVAPATRSTRPAALCTPGVGLLTEKQRTRLEAVFAVEEHVEVEATWGIYQRTVAAYREPDNAKGKQLMQAVIDAVTSGVPTALVEIRRLGRTLKQRAADVLAFFDRPGTSNGPTEAINGRLEHLRGSALGFRNLTNYIARSLLETGNRALAACQGVGGALRWRPTDDSGPPSQSTLCTRGTRSGLRWNGPRRAICG
jgi:hypothetical protein